MITGCELTTTVHWLTSFSFAGGHRDCDGRMPNQEEFEQHLANVEYLTVKELSILASRDFSAINISYTGDRLLGNNS